MATQAQGRPSDPKPFDALAASIEGLRQEVVGMRAQLDSLGRCQGRIEGYEALAG